MAHSKYHSIIKDENDIIDSEEYLEKETQRIENFKSSFKDWMKRLTKSSSANQVNVQPSDSISNAGRMRQDSIAGSRSKAGSSLASAQIVVKARKAALEAEKAELIKEQALEQERFLLEQRRQEMMLEKELAKAEAEEKVYNSIMSSDYSKTKAYSPETKAPVVSENPRAGEAIGRTDIKTGSVLQIKPKQTLSQEQCQRATSKASSEMAEEFIRAVTSIQQQQQQDQMKHMYKMQDSRDEQLQQMFSCHQQMAASLSLPNVEVPVFSGDPVEYCHFLRSFENLIENKTPSFSSRLFYLVSYTSGEGQQLMRSCLTMNPEAGYVEAKRLLKEKYGQNYNIATAYVNRITTAPPIKSEDNVALRSFLVLLVGCKNTLKEIGYRSKIENPDTLLKIIEKLPFSLRQR